MLNLLLVVFYSLLTLFQIPLNFKNMLFIRIDKFRFLSFKHSAYLIFQIMSKLIKFFDQITNFLHIYLS